MQANTKSPLNKQDGSDNGNDLKAKMMNKPRSIKQSKLEGGFELMLKRHDVRRQPGKPPPLASPNTTPNYMKSTRSFQAKKEQSKVSTSSSLKFQKVGKSLSRSTSLNKTRSLTKTPSFKPTRTGRKKWSKVTLYDNLDAKKSTCSSTQKDSKFPPYLKLNLGATESVGSSVTKVCCYDHCSLNGHHHKPPPLKRFLASRRRLMETQRAVDRKPFCPRNKAKGQNDDLFVEVYYVPAKVVAIKDVDHAKQDVKSLDTSSIAETQSETLNDQTLEAENSNRVSLEEVSREKLSIKWVDNDKEGSISHKGDTVEDQEVADFKAENNGCSNLKDYVAVKLPPYYYYEKVREWQHFSDASSSADTGSTQPGDEQSEDYPNSPPDDDATIDYPKLEIKSINERSNVLLTNMHPNIEEGSNKANEDDCTGEETDEEEKDASIIINKRESSVDVTQTIETCGKYQQVDDENTCREKQGANNRTNDEQEETEANSSIAPISRHSEEQDSVKLVKLHPIETCFEIVKEPATEESNRTEESDLSPVNENHKSQNKIKTVSDPNQDYVENSNMLKSWTRCKKTDRGSEEVVKEFNPRGPNFLPIEPEPESEKVDLRHQEMDERRNAEEWMLDNALQKTVNQLASARNKKVALLVEAFESVKLIAELEGKNTHPS